MKLQFLSITSLSLLLLTQKQTHAFSSTGCSSRKRVIYSNNHPIVLSAATAAQGGSSPKNRPLTPKEILARQREKQGLPADVDDHPKLYSDELRVNMQQILLTLEKRVQEGPGSVNSLEAEEFGAMSQSILDEMKQKEYERLEDASSSSSSSSKLVDSTPSSTVITTDSRSSKDDDLPKQLAIIGESASVTTVKDSKSGDTGGEGPAYDPSGGNGSLAKGTTNTYVIPNMDEMSPEEYREALQKSIIDRQSKRKETGNYGNRQTWDYLNNLTGGGSGPLKKEKKEE